MKLSDVIVQLAEYISEYGDEELPDNWQIYEDNSSIKWY